MGRPKGSGTKPKKRKKVTIQLLKRVHAGEVTEPYKILEEILTKERNDLADLKLAIAWRIGWRPDANNILTLGRCRKRGDLDRELDGFDFVVLLNKEAWASLKTKEKQALIFHELCHSQVVTTRTDSQSATTAIAWCAGSGSTISKSSARWSTNLGRGPKTWPRRRRPRSTMPNGRCSRRQRTRRPRTATARPPRCLGSPVIPTRILHGTDTVSPRPRSRVTIRTPWRRPEFGHSASCRRR